MEQKSNQQKIEEIVNKIINHSCVNNDKTPISNILSNEEKELFICHSDKTYKSAMKKKQFVRKEIFKDFVENEFLIITTTDLVVPIDFNASRYITLSKNKTYNIIKREDYFKNNCYLFNITLKHDENIINIEIPLSKVIMLFNDSNIDLKNDFQN